MSYLVEQPPHCDLLRLSLLTSRFVRFRRTHLLFWLAFFLVAGCLPLRGRRRPKKRPSRLTSLDTRHRGDVRVADSAKYDFIIIFFCLFSSFFFLVGFAAWEGVFLDFVDFSEKSLRPETFFFFPDVLRETRGGRTTELTYVGSIPTLGFLKRCTYVCWCTAGRLA